MARPRLISDDAIREAARVVFVQDGPGAPVSRVAERLGVSHAALFARVGTKEQLLREALGAGRPPALEALSEDPPKERAHARLVEVLRELMVFLERAVPGLVVLKASGVSLASRTDAPPVALRRALSRWLSRAIELGAAAPMDVGAVAEGLLGAMEARCFNAYLGGVTHAPGDDLAFLDALVTGLVPAARKARTTAAKRRSSAKR
jgi:AcrR family transcriptional regulator